MLPLLALVCTSTAAVHVHNVMHRDTYRSIAYVHVSQMVCTTLRFEMHVHTILIVLTHQVLHSNMALMQRISFYTCTHASFNSHGLEEASRVWCIIGSHANNVVYLSTASINRFFSEGVALVTFLNVCKLCLGHKKMFVYTCNVDI
jgi:hypothetical protein